MKRKLSLILASIILIIAIPSNVFADKSQEKALEEAILRSKELFNIGSEYDKFDQSISSEDESTVFYLNWSDSKEKLGSINVSIRMDGNVLSYSKWHPSYDEEEIKLPSISKDEGLKIASDFIKKASPDFSEKIKYEEISETLNINSNSYDYNFVRYENDIPYYDNNVSVHVDNLTGEVKNYDSDWDMDLKFIDTKDIITLEESEGLYKEKIGLDLIYKSSYEEEEPNKFLVYGPLDKDLGINAKNGELASIQSDYEIYESTKDSAAEEVEAVELSPEEEKEIREVSGLISKKEAEKLARKILELDKKYKLTNINLYKIEKTNGGYNWEMNFEKDFEGGLSYANISINAKTKKLMNFFKDREIKGDGKIKLNKEESLNLAKKFIRKFNKDNYKELELRVNPVDPDLEKEENYNFTFIRKKDNVYVEEDGVLINVDTVNSKISEYRLTWSDEELPSKDNIITLEKAYDILFNGIGLELKYVDGVYDEKLKKKEAILVYSLKNDKPSNIDANTGKILNDDGMIHERVKVIDYKDIENSYAKDKINILAQYGIGLSGEDFKPKEKISQKEYLYLLLKSKDSYYGREDSEDDLYEQLIRMGIIKEEEKSPETIVSKEEGVKYLIRSLNYSEIADLDHIYKDIFKDTEEISPELKGYISLAYGLEIIQGYDGKLDPKAELKREDAANMIYNLLFKGKQLEVMNLPTELKNRRGTIFINLIDLKIIYYKNI